MTDISAIPLLTANEKDALKQSHDIETIEQLSKASWSDVRGDVNWGHWVSAQSTAEKILESEEMSDEGTPEEELEELREKRDFFDEKGWNSALERVESRIEQLESQVETEELSNGNETELAVLEDQLEFYEDSGYDTLAEKTRKELEELRGE